MSLVKDAEDNLNFHRELLMAALRDAGVVDHGSVVRELEEYLDARDSLKWAKERSK